MAGEWLKFDLSTPEKPEVFAITAALGWDDPDLTVGKLLKMWRWFDQHTVNGNAPSVTLSLLDRLIGVTGFGAAALQVGWLVEFEGGLCLPHFDRHNGKTAKDRALTAKRVANSRAVGRADIESNGECNAETVTSALPRKEKKRKEQNTNTNPADAVASDFDIFWKIFPKRPGASKVDAMKAFKARIKGGITADEILNGTKRYADYCQKTGIDPQFIKHPATFLGSGLHFMADWFAPDPKPTNSAAPAFFDQVAATKKLLESYDKTEKALKPTNAPPLKSMITMREKNYD